MEWPPNAVINFTETRRHDTYDEIDPRKSDMSGRKVMITGASSGCGKAMAIAYAEAAASTIVLLARRDLESVKLEVLNAAEAAGRAKPNVLCLSVDQTEVSQVEGAAERVRKECGRLDVVVNNAGYLEKWKPIVESDPDDWWRTWTVNIKGPYLICRSFIPLLISNEIGDSTKVGPSKDNNGLKTMIQISSVGGLATGEGASAYQMTKSAILRLNNYLRVEYGAKGLLAYSLHPGAVKTSLATGMPEDIHGILIDTPELSANTIVWLTKERREWLQDRFVSANWDMTQLLCRREDVVNGNLLRQQMTC